MCKREKFSYARNVYYLDAETSMKILIHSINFAPELTGIGKYTGEMAAWLAANGHEVRAVVAPPYYPNWCVDAAYKGRLWGAREVWNGVLIWRAPLWVPSKPSALKRIIHLASFALASFPLMVRQFMWRPDVVWLVEPPLFCAPGALLLAKMTGAVSWLHVQDYEVDAAFSLGILKAQRTRRLITYIESWLMRRFRYVSSISSSMTLRAINKGIDPERIYFFPNWIDLSLIRPITHTSRFRVELGIPANAVVALYSGNMGEKQGLEILAQAANALEGEENLYFVFCGNGAGKPGLIELCYKLSNVLFIDLQPMDRLNELLGMADIHLLPQRAEAADLVMPSKLTGMLASGRCIVATADITSELGKIVQRCGVIVSPGNLNELTTAILSLKTDGKRRAALGQAGRLFAESWLDINLILKNFVAKLESKMQ